MPTPPTPGWKLPVAVGWRSPILRLALMPSTARSWGDWRTLVRASLSTAWRRALGTVMAQSAVESLPRLDNGICGPVVVLPESPDPLPLPLPLPEPLSEPLPLPEPEPDPLSEPLPELPV